MPSHNLLKPGQFDRYFLMFDACALLFLALIASEIAGYGGALVGALQVAWAALLLVLFPRKRRDEFAEHCWRRATSATFLMLVLAPIAIGFTTGLVDGFTHAPKRTDVHAGMDELIMILLATFHGVFEWTRFRATR